uniref:Uncharacterized protein n=1 Tax=Strongyloides stercoralis TaxID=6248 RepID=A0A0K0EBC6_STRER
MIRVLMNQVIHLYQFENDYQSMDDKLLRTCVYGISDKRNYFKQDAIFLCFFGQSHQDKKHCISPAQQVLFFYNFIDLSYKKSCSIKIILCLMNYLF